jgi:hypothetical protein
MEKHKMRHLQKYIFKMLQVTTYSLQQIFPRLTLQTLKFKRNNKFLKKLHNGHNMEPQKFLVINISKVADGLNNLNISTLFHKHTEIELQY